MASKKQQFKRSGRLLDVGALADRVLDPVMKKRGFASRDIISQWAHIVPAPYAGVTIPDRLKWRRGEAGAEGALLFLRCEEAHRMAVTHDQALIIGAVNRYFGYVLVDALKLSAEPFTAGSGGRGQIRPEPSAAAQSEIEAKIADVKDDRLKDALRKWGQGMMSDQPPDDSSR